MSTSRVSSATSSAQPMCARKFTAAQCFQLVEHLSPTRALYKAACRRLRDMAQTKGTEAQTAEAISPNVINAPAVTNPSRLEPFVPAVVWRAATCPALVHQVLLPAVRASASFCASAYFYARSVPRLKAVKERVYAAAPIAEQRELAATDAFVNALLAVIDARRRDRANHRTRGRLGSASYVAQVTHGSHAPCTNRPLNLNASPNSALNLTLNSAPNSTAQLDSKQQLKTTEQQMEQQEQDVEREQRVEQEQEEQGATIDEHILACRPRLPGSLRYRVIRVRCAEATELASYTRPWVVPCTLHDAWTGTYEERVLMIKHEPVFKDDAVQRIQQYLLHADPDLDLVPYEVMPVAPDRGFILFLDSSEPLAGIQKKGTLLDYLLAQNQHKTVGEVQRTFMRSCAASAVLSLLCGFGDRHLNNILVRGTSLVHVDFEYLFGEEPALSTTSLTLPPQTVRLTKPMLDVFSATHYDEFLAQCAAINRLARSVAPDIYCIAQSLAAVGAVTHDRLEKHFNQFLLPYTVTSNREADQFILSVVENNTQASSSTGFRGLAGAVLERLFR